MKCSQGGTGNFTDLLERQIHFTFLKIVRWMFNITILNVGRPNFSCEFPPTRFSSVLLENYYIIENREFSSSFIFEK